jgi:hypothetical protein
MLVAVPVRLHAAAFTPPPSRRRLHAAAFTPPRTYDIGKYYPQIQHDRKRICDAQGENRPLTLIN